MNTVDPLTGLPGEVGASVALTDQIRALRVSTFDALGRTVEQLRQAAYDEGYQDGQQAALQDAGTAHVTTIEQVQLAAGRPWWARCRCGWSEVVAAKPHAVEAVNRHMA